MPEEGQHVKATDVHLAAVEAAIADSAIGLTPADAPLLELVRVLARQVDAAGPDGPGTRLAATYLTGVRTLHARLSSVVKPTNTTRLAQMRAEHMSQQTRGRGAA